LELVIFGRTQEEGSLVEFGFFLNGGTGYAIGEGDGSTAMKNVAMFRPYWIGEVKEIVSHEQGKDIMIAIVKARIEAAN